MMGARSPCQPLDARTFHTIAELAYRESGLTLVAQKAPMVQSRLRHRLQALGFSDFTQYADYLTSAHGNTERRQLISALTTNVSRFFRESHHFEMLVDLVQARLPALRAGAPLRLWSAGCSQGQEPLSMAMALFEEIPEVADFDLRILATDIDPHVIAFAKAGRYAPRLLEGVSAEMRGRYFGKQIADNGNTVFTPHRALTSIIRYRELNLLGDWPMRMPFDAIFCRNTIIYFDIQTQEALWPRFRHILHQHGRLFLGHSERIAKPALRGFVGQGPTTYQPACQ